MKKNNERSMITSLNKKRKISVQEFDQLFDHGSDKIDEYVDWTQAKPGLTIEPGQRVILQTLLNGKIFSQKAHTMSETKKQKSALRTISASETLLYKNKSVLASVRKGLKESAHGMVSSLGSFAS